MKTKLAKGKIVRGIFFTILMGSFLLLGQTKAFGQTQIGMNLGAMGGNSTEFVYKDLCKMMIGQRSGSGFVASQFDVNGYPTYLNNGQQVTLAYGSGTNQIWPTGDYNIFFDGQGTIAEVTGSATLKQDLGNGHQIWTVIHGGSDYIKFAITATTSSNYLKNLRIILPGFENDYTTDPIHPTFRTHWAMFAAFRFMDWQGINGSPIVSYANVMPAGYICSGYSGTWGDATFPSDPTGGSPELAAQLCNLMNKDMWINIPAMADDNCITQIATLIKSKLNSNLKVYVEYSNECWNWMFTQTSYMQDKGIALGLTTSGSMQYYTYRCGQMYKLWETVWGANKDRVINVFAWQTTNINPDMWIDLAFSTWFKSSQYNPGGVQPEFYANAPYMWDQDSWSNNYPANVDQAFAGVNADLDVDNAIITSQKAYATAHGLQYGTYEAGQHWTTGGSNIAADAVYIQANRDSRMGSAYTQYLNNWKNNGNGLMMLYSSCGVYANYGSWGLIEYYNQDVNTAPKYLAVKNFLSGTNVAVTGVSVSPTTASVAVGATTNLNATVAPNNATNQSVTWSSNNTAVATVNSSGVVTGVAAGSATITVKTSDGNKTATCAITITSSNVAVTGVTVSPQTASVAVGATTALTATVTPSNATNKSVTWSTSNSSIASVSSSGIVTGVAVGTATITVTTVNGGKTATCAVTVTAQSTTKYEAENAALSGSAGVWSDHAGYSGIGFVGFPSQGATCSFSVNAVSAGSFTIVTTYSDGGSGSSNPSLSLYLNGFKIKQLALPTPGGWVTETESLTLTAGNNTIAYKWDSGDNGGVNLDFITVVGSGAVAVTGVSVSPTSASIAVGSTKTLSATVAPSNATNKTVSWSSSNTGIATVSTTGVVTGVAAGSATITVKTTDGNKTATSTITVTAATNTTTKFEAEKATLSGGAGIWSDHAGYSGTGFVGFPSQGAAVTFTVNASQATSSNVAVTFAGNSGAKTMNLYLNNVKIKQVTLNATGLDTWNIRTETLSLLAGNNTIAYKWESGNTGGVNIDFINVTGAGTIKNSLVINGIALSKTSNGISVYPNPAIDAVNLKIAGQGNNAVVSVFDITGKEILKSQLVGQEGLYQLNTGNLANGLYFINVTQGNTNYLGKISIKR